MRHVGHTWLVLGLLSCSAVGLRAQQDDQTMAMTGPLGESDSRHASGTSWLPDDSPQRAAMVHTHGWMIMTHGQAFGQYIKSSGDRGDEQFGSINWLMAMAQHDLLGGQLIARGMFSLERLTTGLCGYPDLAQTGPMCGPSVRDLQHPHDLFMEVGADYRRAISDSAAIELYGGPAGEPALGPVSFPHRLSALPNPIAPMAHHWLDVTHITFGVVTAGVYSQRWKGETSFFNARHSDDQRYGFDLAPLNSTSGRLWFLPTPQWSLQFSGARLRAPEGHDHAANAPDVTSVRLTASATYQHLAGRRLWASTVAWGQNRDQGVSTNAVLAESALDLRPADTVFARAEIVQKTPADVNLATLEQEIFTMTKLQAGYMRTIGSLRGVETGIGGSVGLVLVPKDVEFIYGGTAAGEFAVFFSVRPGRLP